MTTPSIISFPKPSDPDLKVVVVLDATEMLQLYNAAAGAGPESTIVDHDVQTWITNRAKTSGWISSEFVGTMCILKAAETISLVTKPTTEKVSERAAIGTNQPMLRR